MSALETLAQAILDGRVSLLPIVVHNVGDGYQSHFAPVYAIVVEPVPDEVPS